MQVAFAIALLVILTNDVVTEGVPGLRNLHPAPGRQHRTAGRAAEQSALAGGAPCVSSSTGRSAAPHHPTHSHSATWITAGGDCLLTTNSINVCRWVGDLLPVCEAASVPDCLEFPAACQLGGACSPPTSPSHMLVHGALLARSRSQCTSLRQPLNCCSYGLAVCIVSLLVSLSLLFAVVRRAAVQAPQATPGTSCHSTPLCRSAWEHARARLCAMVPSHTPA